MTTGTTRTLAPTASRLRVTVLDRMPGAGIVAAGWITDVSKRIEAITVFTETELITIDLLRDTLSPVTPQLAEAFGVPWQVTASHAFVLYLPSESSRWSGGLQFQIWFADGAIERSVVSSTGHLCEVGRIIEIAPLDDALRLARHVLDHCRRGNPEATTVPAMIQTWQSQLHQRIARQSENVGRVITVVRVETDGILLRCRFSRGAVVESATIALVSFGGCRVILDPGSRVDGARGAGAPCDAAPGMRHEYVAFAAIPGLRQDEQFWFVEVSDAGGLIGRIPFLCGPAPPLLRGIEAALALIEPPPEPEPERVVAPAVDAFWRAARRHAPVAMPAAFGSGAVEPQVSVIIPLNGHLDYMRHQIAQFSNDQEFRLGGIVELIYVVVDASLTGEFRHLSQCLYDIYGVPFRTLLFDHSRGSAVAANLGADAAVSDVILFLGADVLPKESLWVGRLLRQYNALDRCGILGCRLLSEDRSIRHYGITFRPSKLVRGLWEEHAPLKGLPTDFDPACDARRATVVTSACMMIDSQLFRQLGGFCEEYVFGDFADYDICLAARQECRHTYYTPRIELYQLAAPTGALTRSREQLIRYNRWKHNRKWHNLIQKVLAEVEQ